MVSGQGPGCALGPPAGASHHLRTNPLSSPQAAISKAQKASGDDGKWERAMEDHKQSLPEIDPYILRPLMQDVPLLEDGEEQNARISCVEVWSMSLPFTYISILSYCG